MSEQAELKTNPLLHTCSWSGEEFEGKAYILQTTEGPEMVSPAALFAGTVPIWHVENIEATERQEREKVEAEAAEAAKKAKGEELQAAAQEKRAAARKTTTSSKTPAE